MDEYPTKLAKQRQKLLNYLKGQGHMQYRYDTYLTLELLSQHIESLGTSVAANALELLQFIAFLHYQRISETILENAWINSQGTSRDAVEGREEMRLIELAQSSIPRHSSLYLEPAG